MWLDSKNGYDKNIQCDVTKLYKWIWQNFTKGCDKTILINLSSLTNGYDKT